MPDLWVSCSQDTLGDSDSTESFPEMPWGPGEILMVERFANYCIFGLLGDVDITVAREGFPRQEYRIGLSFPPLGDVPDSGIKPCFAARFFTAAAPGKPEQCLKIENHGVCKIFGEFTQIITKGVCLNCSYHLLTNHTWTSIFNSLPLFPDFYTYKISPDVLETKQTKPDYKLMEWKKVEAEPGRV